jgi:hypothetical protein
MKAVNSQTSRLVWEERLPQYATYIFEWPGNEKLVDVIEKVLRHHRRDIPQVRGIGFVARVVHEKGIGNWKKKVRNHL